MTFNHSFSQQAYCQTVGNSPTNYPILSDRDPNVNDIYYKIGQFWMNTQDIRLWYLNSQSNVSGVLQSSWVEISNGLANVDQLQGDDGIPVSPSAGIIQTLGNTVANSTHSKPLYVASGGGNIEQFNVQVSAAIASTDINKAGISSFDNSRFTVDANGFVSVNGSGIGETITGNSGGALSPTAGNWNIFGSAVAAGSTPVATSGSVSTLTVNVQRSQAIASTNAANVGLAAFNSSQFTVDANGFVSSIGNTVSWQTISSSQTLVKNTGYFCVSPGGALSLALPSTASSTIGDIIEVSLDGSTSWTITQAVGQQIRIANTQTTSGAGGSLTSTAQGDTLKMVYQSSGKWNVISFVGNITVV